MLPLIVYLGLAPWNVEDHIRFRVRQKTDFGFSSVRYSTVNDHEFP